ncbi:hypothetical protein MJ1_0040 [Nanobdella aerobiophila]|uniref:Uncharacterized protein n=1 Tax=Nanobdella aerobiophila TaxID=2586965 RepID=A0A915WRG9_9ARCH|nr:hypothetical protein [Nanobdella aerobiophila]BBL45219.1 hypothetical protein MJ1_0040 [Nanobdella aerobiophila]
MKTQFGSILEFVGYYLVIFIIILAGIFFILTYIFKFNYNINLNPSVQISLQNQNANNNVKTNNYTYNVLVYVYYNYNNYVYLTQGLPGTNNTYNYSIVPYIGNSLAPINPQIAYNNMTSTLQFTSNANENINFYINLSNQTYTGTEVDYNNYQCQILPPNEQIGSPNQNPIFCIECTGGNKLQYFYLQNPEYLNVTPAISLLDGYPNVNYYNYTINNLYIENMTAISLESQDTYYTLSPFQDILVEVVPPFSNYINSYDGINADNVLFLIYYNNQYYVLPSYYAGNNNNIYYFFVNLLNFPQDINNNGGCNFLTLYVAFSNQDLLTILNGTLGGDPYALNNNNPGEYLMYDNGLNVFPIYVNFYNYNGLTEESIISCNSNLCFQPTKYNTLPTYNVENIYANNTSGSPLFYSESGLQMLNNGGGEGSYIAVNSTLLDNFDNFIKNNNINNQNYGDGINTYIYVAGDPWEDSPSTGLNPEVADAVAFSITNQNIFTGNLDSILPVGGSTPVPNTSTTEIFEYGWACTSPGAGCSSGYYVGIPIKYYCGVSHGSGGSTWSILLNISTSESSNCASKVKEYYYAGSANGGSNYYFGENNNIGSSNSYIPFAPEDQQKNYNYEQYGILYTYNWYLTNPSSNSQLNNYFLMNGNIYNYPLPKINQNTPELIQPESPGENAGVGPALAISYYNSYQTAFEAEDDMQLSEFINYNGGKGISGILCNSLPNGFISGTFGYMEYCQGVYNRYIDNLVINNFGNQPFIYFSAGDGGGTSYIYLDWLISSFGVPYVVYTPS